jgi:nucleotide-binding universal stress UspA family protein
MHLQRQIQIGQMLHPTLICRKARVLKAGRPVLLVPNEVTSFSGKRIAIAWKDTREARRAVVDSLPFLQMAESVTVFEVCKDDFPSKLDDVAGFLGWHRVDVTCRRLQPLPDMSTAQCLLPFSKGENIDLIVAGDYGHTRLGEWIFGGSRSRVTPPKIHSPSPVRP